MARFGILRAGVLTLLASAAHANTAAPLGYPAAAKPWTQSEYVQFYFAHFNGNQALPHMRSDAGRALVARLVDRGNVEELLARAATPEDRQMKLAVIIMTIGELRAAYNTSVIVGEPLTTELAQIQAFQLYLIDTAWRIPAEPRTFPAWKTSLLGVFISLTEVAVYSPGERAVMAGALADHLPGMPGLLTAGDRARLADEAAAMAAGSTDAGLRAALRRLEAALRAP